MNRFISTLCMSALLIFIYSSFSFAWDSSWSAADKRHFEADPAYEIISITNNPTDAWTEADQEHFETDPTYTVISKTNNPADAWTETDREHFESDPSYEIIAMTNNPADAWAETDNRHFNAEYETTVINGTIIDSLKQEQAREEVLTNWQKHELAGGKEQYHYKYHMPDHNRNGTLSGYTSAYTYRPGKKDLLYNKAINTYRLDGRYSEGDVNIEDSEITSQNFRADNVDQRAWELRGLIGKEYIVDNNQFLLYGGLGQRYHKNGQEVGEDANDPNYGYWTSSNKQNYTYIPLGVEYTTFLKNNWNLTFKGEYDWFLFGTDKEVLARATYSGDDFEYDFNNGFGIQGSLKFAKKSPFIDFFIEPFFRLWAIDHSEYIEGDRLSSGSVLTHSTNWGMDENYSRELGVKFGAAF